MHLEIAEAAEPMGEASLELLDLVSSFGVSRNTFSASLERLE